MNEDREPSTVISIEIARHNRGRVESRKFSVPASYPRVNIEDPVLVTLGNGMVIKARLGDLTCDGIKLWTNRITANALHPTGHFIDSDTAPKVEVFLDLPLPGGELRVGVRCRIARFEKVSSDEFSFTLHFLTFEGAGESVVRHYVKLTRGVETTVARRKAKVLYISRG